jgi:tetratricopeptide (TPR) repeat protein
MLQFIPSDIELFNTFINQTDDCQLTIREHTIYPKDAEGKTLYSSPDKKVLHEPAWKTWDWTEEESRQWSQFRQRNDELYRAYTGAKDEERNRLQELLNENISACITYDQEHRIIERLFFSDQSYGKDREAFGIKQDKLQYETAVRTITLLYEKQIPLSDFEKQFIDKYIALHDQLPGRISKLCSEIKVLHQKLPELWGRIFVAKEKADKATNSIYIPPPEMKGSYSPIVSLVVPSAEEMQQRVDDFNQYMQQFDDDVRALCDAVDDLKLQVYDEDDDGNSTDPLYNEVDSMEQELRDNWEKYSLDTTSVYLDFDEYKGVSWNEEKKLETAWYEFIDENNLFMDMFNEFIGFLNDKFSPQHDENITKVSYTDELKNGIDPGYDSDDPRAETIHRFESGMGSPYFDVDDWHVILDHYQHIFDEKNKALALEKAFTQHPGNALLILRKAEEEAGKHEYKKALALVKQAEAQGPPHHPNLYFIKANILCQVHAQEKAIPLYNKIIGAKGPELEVFREHARYRLLDIYEEQKKYSECIRLSKELIEKNPDDENLVANLSSFYRMNAMFKEAEETAKNFLEKFPQSAACIEQLGHLYFETKEYRKAIDQFESSYTLNKNENYNSIFYQGNAYMELKHFSDAAVCFETCLFYFPLDKNYHVSAARCYKEMKMPYASVFHLRKALEIDPECAEALQQLQLSGN